MEREQVSKKVMINCKEAGLLNTMKEGGSINLYQRMQLGFHTMICGVCKVWAKQSADLNKLIKSAFSSERHKMPDEKKDKIEKELDKHFI